MRKLLLSLTAAVAVAWALLVVLSQRPGEVGLIEGALRASSNPKTAWCSQMGTPESRVEPLYVGPEVERAWAKLLEILQTESEARIRAQTGDWVAFSWRSLPFALTADLEVLRLSGADVLHVRSASRLGILSMGSHRRGLARLRELLAASLAKSDAP